MSLFSSLPQPEKPVDFSQPLAERMRPRTLAEFVGQQQLVGEGRVLRRIIEGRGALPSLIFWGAPGTGKTTLARLLAVNARAAFEEASAVNAGRADDREHHDQHEQAQQDDAYKFPSVSHLKHLNFITSRSRRRSLLTRRVARLAIRAARARRSN